MASISTPPKLARPQACNRVIRHSVVFVCACLATCLGFQRIARAQPQAMRPPKPPSDNLNRPNIVGSKIHSPESEPEILSVVGRAEASLVAIARVPQGRKPNDRSAFNPLEFDRQSFPGAIPSIDPDFVPNFVGSGIIISDDGFIVTCAHVLDDPLRNDYYVWLNKKIYPTKAGGTSATVFASDPFSDLAVLKIDCNGLVPAEFDHSPNLRVGQSVIAIGNPEGIAAYGKAKVSHGFISALSRFAPQESDGTNEARPLSLHHYGTLIQTDERIRHGASGGALLNRKGKVVGLTTALAAQAGLDRPAGLAIAVNHTFLRIVNSLKKGKLPEFGFLGIQPDDANTDGQEISGARISLVLPGLPGDKAGLRENDIITKIGKTAIRNRNDLFRELSLLSPGESVEIYVSRSSQAQRPIRLTAHVSKKATGAPGYQLHSPTDWRGMAVEYVTVILTNRARGGFFNQQPSQIPPVAVLSVTPNTPAWSAGIRPGCGLRSVNGIAIESPEQFRNLVSTIDGPVEMTVVQDGRTVETVIADGAED